MLKKLKENVLKYLNVREFVEHPGTHTPFGGVLLTVIFLSIIGVVGYLGYKEYAHPRKSWKESQEEWERKADEYKVLNSVVQEMNKAKAKAVIPDNHDADFPKRR